MDDNTLKPVSITLLSDGLTVRGDVFGNETAHLLIKDGTVLDAKMIDVIKKLNGDSDRIYISSSLYKALVGEGLPCEVLKLGELEKTTGYLNVKDKTFELLTEMSKNETIQQEALSTVADELSHRLEVATPSVITTLINALAPVDEYLQRHCVNLGLLNGLFGRWLGLPKKAVDDLVLIGLLHDCGKALLPAQVLSAPRRLTSVEFEVVKMHTVYTYKLLTDFTEHIRHSASSHHERINGAGYPSGLVQSNISLEARITAITDVYDAVVSQRAYKEPRSPFSVMAMLAGLRGSELDPELVDVFNSNMLEELIDKPVVMSDGTIGVVRSCDPGDIENPTIEIAGIQVKSSQHLYCVSMHTEE